MVEDGDVKLPELLVGGTEAVAKAPELAVAAGFK